ncbi:MAG: SLC13 family permease, partial [Methanomassiliicoccales archaeon]
LADRTVLVIAGSLLMVGLGIISLDDALKSIEWNAIGLIFGMFILIGALAESGFFRWIGLHFLRLTQFDAIKIFIAFCGLCAFLAAFMDSITVMVFMASLTIEVATILKIEPLPFIIAEICSANIGGSATLVGDPPNVILGTAFNFSFVDFVLHSGPISIIAFFANLLLFMYAYRRNFKKQEIDVEEIIKNHKDLDPFSAVRDITQMRIALVIFAFTVTLLVLHSVLDLLVAFVAVLGGTLILLLGRRKYDDLIQKIDWHTIIFLSGLFVMVGGLESAGLLSNLGHQIGQLAHGTGSFWFPTIFFWFIATASIFLDNIPMAAAMVPVIRTISVDSEINLSSLTFTASLACDVAGNATPISASANVVGLAVAEKNGIKWSWKEYCKLAIPILLIVLLLTNLLVVILLW